MPRQKTFSQFWLETEMSIYKASSKKELQLLKKEEKKLLKKLKMSGPGYFATGIKNRRKFLEMDHSYQQLTAWYELIAPYEQNKRYLAGGTKGPKMNLWHPIKYILLSKNCPQTIRDKYVSHPMWWKRMSAMQSKHVRKQYWDKAISDPHPYVRKCAYLGCDWIPEPELVKIISKDKIVLRDWRFRDWIKRERLVRLHPVIALTDPDPAMRAYAEHYVRKYVKDV